MKYFKGKRTNSKPVYNVNYRQETYADEYYESITV